MVDKDEIVTNKEDGLILNICRRIILRTFGPYVCKTGNQSGLMNSISNNAI